MAGAGRVNDIATSTLHAHFPPCPLCPHTVAGPALKGASHTIINNQPALRSMPSGDGGLHAICCRLNVWKTLKTLQERYVIVEGAPLLCQGDITLHCSVSVGLLTTGSADVRAGENL